MRLVTDRADQMIGKRFFVAGGLQEAVTPQFVGDIFSKEDELLGTVADAHWVGGEEDTRPFLVSISFALVEVCHATFQSLLKCLSDGFRECWGR